MVSPHLTPPAPDPPRSSLSVTAITSWLRTFFAGPLPGVFFLVSQVIFILVTHFSSTSPRLLTPVDGLTRYELHATFGRRPLTPAEIRKRYGVAAQDDSALTTHAMRAVIAYAERPAPPAQNAYVRLRLRAPNRAEDYWLWPQE